MEVFEFIAFWLDASWDFFTEINVPGFDFSIAALSIGVFLASLGLRLLCMMLGIGIHSTDIKTVAGTGSASKPVSGFGNGKSR